MARNGFIAVCAPGTADKEGRRKGSRPWRDGQRGGKRGLTITRQETDFRNGVWIRLRGILRTAHFQRLIGAAEVEFFGAVVLGPLAGYFIRRAVQSPMIFGLKRGNFKT